MRHLPSLFALSRACLILLALAAPAFAAGCATTQPWERGTLASPLMDPDGDHDREGLRQHTLGTREGAVGSLGGGGGGCGCN